MTQDDLVSALLDAFPDSAALLNRDGTIRGIGRATAESLNTTQKAAIGQSVYDLLPSELAASRRKRLERVLETGRAERFRDTRNGRTFENSVFPALDRNGRVECLVIYGKEITDQVRAEAALKEKTEQLRTILDALPQMVAYIDKELVYRFVNRTYAAFFDSDVKSIVGMRADALVGEDAARKTASHVLQALSGHPVDYEETYAYPGQPPRRIQGRLLPDITPSGEVAGYYAVLADVTDMAQSLARAEAREKELSALLAASRAIYEEATFEAIARKIFDICRETIGARSGYVAMLNEDGSENELLFLEAGGRPCDVDPDLPMPIRGLRETAYRSGRPVYDNDFHHSDWMRLMPQGHVRLDNVMFAPLNVAEKTVGLIGVANKPEDFTDNDARLAGAFAELTAVAFQRIQDESAVRESEARYRALFESASDALLVADPRSGILVDANHRAEELLGRPRHALVGMHQSDLHPAKDAPAYRQKFRIATGKKGHFFNEVEVVHADGRRIPVEISSGGNIVVQGRELHFGLFRDITERKQAEKALRRSEAELRLLSSRLMAAQEDERRRISAALHDDLGQALMVLKLQLRAALNGLKDGRATAVDDFESALGAINDIAENLRRIARELSPAVLENFGLVPALKWLADQYAPHLETIFQDNGVLANGRLPQKTEAAVFRICQEAMTNVVRHAGADRVEMRMEERNGALVVSIRDNGRGFNVKRAETPEAVPTGLGMLSIFERARLIEARLNVSSKPGNGTALSLEIPLKKDS